jgi:hypothetical protein
MFGIFFFKLQCWYVCINELLHRKNDLIFIIMWFVDHVGNDDNGFFLFLNKLSIES